MSDKQVVLITGASSGMGKETAKTLIQEGYIVYTAARRVEKMEDLKQLGGIPLKMDVTKEEDLVAGVEQIKKDRGGVDILINNAGFGQYGPMEDTPLDKARYQFDVNLFGLARLTQLVLPYMREKKAGKIVNISSMGGKIYTPLGAWYHATKHAVEGWSDCLRFELKPFNIDVIIIEPGLIDTGFYDVVSGTIPPDSANGPYKEIGEWPDPRCRKRYERIAALGDRQYDLQSDQGQPTENALCGWRYGQTADFHAEMVWRSLL